MAGTTGILWPGQLVFYGFEPFKEILLEEVSNIYTYIHIYIYTYIHYTYIHVYMYICIYVYMYMCVCICMYLHVFEKI